MTRLPLVRGTRAEKTWTDICHPYRTGMGERKKEDGIVQGLPFGRDIWLIGHVTAGIPSVCISKNAKHVNDDDATP